MYGKLQLKQLPPASRSAVALQALIGKAAAKRYSDPERLYIAFAVNRPGELDLGALKADALNGHVVEAWVYGRQAVDRTSWFFYGDMLEDAGTYSVKIEDILPMEDSPEGNTLDRM